MRARSSAVSAHKEASDHTTSLSLDFGTIYQLQVASSMETTKIFTNWPFYLYKGHFISFGGVFIVFGGGKVSKSKKKS